MSAVTVQNVVDFVNPPGGLGAMPAAFQTQLQMVLDGFQGDVEAYLGRPIEIRDFIDEYDWTGGDDFLRLRQSPVASVQDITAETITSAGTVTDRLEVDFYTVTSWGIAGLATIPATYPYILVVSYRAGLDLTNKRYVGIRNLILNATKRWYYQEINHVMQQTQGGAVKKLATDGGYAVTFDYPKPLAPYGQFEPGELDTIKRFRRRGVR